MAISAADIKKLRESTGAGMTDCKNALVEADGDYDKAVEILRIKGLKGVAKREGRAASNGLIASVVEEGKRGTMLELNCETDFVAKGDRFITLADRIVNSARGVNDPKEIVVDGKPIQEVLDDAGAQLGEKIEARRVASFDGAHVGVYLHRTNPDLPPQVGVLVELSADNARGLFIPEGVAHGFLTLEPHTDVLYQISPAFAPGHEAGVRWDDPAFAIAWPSAPKVISERDLGYPDHQG